MSSEIYEENRILNESLTFLNSFCLIETNSGSSCSFHESNLAGEEDVIHAFSVQTSLDPKRASTFEKSQLITDVP